MLKQRVYSFLAIVLLVAPLLLIYRSDAEAVIGDLRFEQLELAESDSERALGLSGRDSLCSKCGMLFIFNESAKHSFWMKDMNFQLDILWLDADYEVIHIVRDARPEGSRPTRTYAPDAPARYVLEVNAGASGEHSIDIGDKLKL